MLIGAIIIPRTDEIVMNELGLIVEKFRPRGIFGEDILIIDPVDITETIVRLFMFSRTIFRVYLILDKFDIATKSDLYERSKAIDWASIFDVDMSFAIAPESDTLSRYDVGKLVGQGVVDRFKEEVGKRPKVDLKNPEVSIIAKIVGKECLLGVDITGFDLNDINEIVSRLIILASGLSRDDRLGEIFHNGICESAYEYINNVPLKDRIVDTTYVNLKVVEQNRVIELLSRNWEDKRDGVACYEMPNKAIKFRYPIQRKDIDFFVGDNIDIVCSNLVSTAPSKSGQDELIKRIILLMEKNSFWNNAAILCRKELIHRLQKFKCREIITINIRGITSSIIRIERE